jgi:hypothetical protein
MRHFDQESIQQSPPMTFPLFPSVAPKARFRQMSTVFVFQKYRPEGPEMRAASMDHPLNGDEENPGVTVSE